MGYFMWCCVGRREMGNECYIVVVVFVVGMCVVCLVCVVVVCVFDVVGW